MQEQAIHILHIIMNSNTHIDKINPNHQQNTITLIQCLQLTTDTWRFKLIISHKQKHYFVKKALSPKTHIPNSIHTKNLNLKQCNHNHNYKLCTKTNTIKNFKLIHNSIVSKIEALPVTSTDFFDSNLVAAEAEFSGAISTIVLGRLEAYFSDSLRRNHPPDSSENSPSTNPTRLDGDEGTGDEPSRDSDGL